MKIARISLLAVSASLLLLSSGVALPQAAAGGAVEGNRKALNEIFKDYWEDGLKHQPEFASTLGDKRYNDQISTTP